MKFRVICWEGLSNRQRTIERFVSLFRFGVIFVDFDLNMCSRSRKCFLFVEIFLEALFYFKLMKLNEKWKCSDQEFRFDSPLNRFLLSWIDELNDELFNIKVLLIIYQTFLPHDRIMFLNVEIVSVFVLFSFPGFA